MAQMVEKVVINSLLLVTYPTVIALRVEAIAHRVVGVRAFTFTLNRILTF